MKEPSWLSMQEVLDDLSVPREKTHQTAAYEGSRRVPANRTPSTTVLPGNSPNPLGRRKEMKEPSWLSMQEVLDDLSVPRSTMNDWRARKRGPRFVKLPGGQLRVSRVEYEAWCASFEEAAA